MDLAPVLLTAAYLGWAATVAARSYGQSGPLVLAAALGGIATSFATALLAPVLGGGPGSWPSFVQVWSGAPSTWLPAVEEAGKALVLVSYHRRRRQHGNGAHGILYGLAVGVGYALLGQLAFRLRGAPLRPELQLHVLGVALAQAMLPAMYGALLGLGQGFRYAGPLRWGIGVAGWVAGSGLSVALLHLARFSQVAGPWQALAQAALLLWEWLPVGLLAFLHVRARRQEQEVLLLFLREEVTAGVLTDAELSSLRVDRGRLPKPLRAALFRLAWAKWRLVRGLAREDEVEAWRNWVRTLRRTP